MIRRIVSITAVTAFSLLAQPMVHAALEDGVPFQQLQQQIDTLNAQVKALAEQIGEGGGGDQTVAVNCPGDAIGSALAQAKPGGVLTLTITGTCTENVAITRNDVMLQGSGQVVGQITVDGAQRVAINGLTLTGPGSGIEARSNAAITVSNATIENNEIFGIDVRHGAFAVIDGNTIRFNGQCEVLVRDSGHARILNNIIEANQSKPSSCTALVGIYRNSMVRMVGGNTITNTASSGFALEVEFGSTFRQDGPHDTITGNVLVLTMANADFRDMSFTGNVQVVENATFRTRNSTITGNITIGSRSLAVFNATPTTVDGIVTCLGSGTVGLGPPAGLTLVDSQSGPVLTSAGGIGWAFRGAVFGAPNFVGAGGFNGCN